MDGKMAGAKSRDGKMAGTRIAGVKNQDGIASEAKQSGEPIVSFFWIASSLRSSQ